MELFLEIYGIGVLIKSGSAQILEWLRFDFSCFPASESFTPVLTVEAVVSPVPEGAIPPIEESVHSPLFVSYDDGEIRYVDYYGRALTVMDYSREHATLWCPDADFAYEKLYLLVLSRVGEMLDRKGLHRVHGLGFSYRDRGVLILLPMRGGKSTIALSLMNDADVRLFSEDTPLLDREGVMHPFPVRLGVRAGGSMPDIPPEYVREFRRSEHGPKMLISTEALAGHIAAGKIQVSHLIVGKWSRASVPSIRPLNRLSATGKLFRDCVFGLGLPQVVEYFLRTPLVDLIHKTPLTLSRIWACARVIFRARCSTLVLCSDIRANINVLKDFLLDDFKDDPESRPFN